MLTLPQRLELLAFDLALEHWPQEDLTLLYEAADCLRGPAANGEVAIGQTSPRITKSWHKPNWLE
jgi:hypothetical protein